MNCYDNPSAKIHFDYIARNLYTQDTGSDSIVVIDKFMFTVFIVSNCLH